jgi:hypothetical protein
VRAETASNTVRDDDLHLLLIKKLDRLIELLLALHTPKAESAVDYSKGEWFLTEKVIELTGAPDQRVREWCRNHVGRKHPGVKRDNEKTYGSFWVHESLIPGWRIRYDKIRARQKGMNGEARP